MNNDVTIIQQCPFTFFDPFDTQGLYFFFFQAFNEKWKDDQNPSGSENHFGLFTLDGKAKYALWDLVDQGVFDGLTRNGNPITKTYNGSKEELMKDVLVPDNVFVNY